uniref:Gfo/Idh/MocA-like oxidoreductase C-terminal domain-containing protein n=1 Tax=Oryza punctata TaxID=4537 RepID=A0A0E0LZ84_ORYPU
MDLPRFVTTSLSRLVRRRRRRSLARGLASTSHVAFQVASHLHSLLMIGSEVATVSSISRHVDKALPPPDNICSLFQLENGCAGVFVFAVNSRSPKILWRVDGTKGTVQIERGIASGKHGYQVLFTNENGQCQMTFYPFCGVNEELKAFVHDIVQAKKDGDHKAESRSSYVEGARDVAVLEAMLESSAKQGATVQVKKF